MNEIYSELNKIFRDVFDDETITVTETTTTNDIEGWDSLEHINIILAIEQEFRLKFSMDEIGKMKNVGAMVDIIAARAKRF